MERERSPLRPRAVDFRLTFSQTQALKSFFDNVHNNLRELEISVVKSATFEGFQVDSMNESHSVVLNGRLAAEVELNLPQASFCVVVKSVINLLRNNVKPMHFVDFLRYEGDALVKLHVYEPGRLGSGLGEFGIQTLDRESIPSPLIDMTFTHHVEVQLEPLKAALRTANAEEIDSIALEVRERSAAEEDPEFRTLWFVVCFNDEHRTRGEYAWRSRIKISEGGAMIMAVNDRNDEEATPPHGQPEPYTRVYREQFYTEHLWNFVRSMDRTTATFRLCANRPLLLEYPLGDAATDYLRFVLAPTA